MFDLLQTRQVYPFYDRILNTTNGQNYFKESGASQAIFTDTIHIVNYIPPFLQPIFSSGNTSLEAIPFKEFKGFMADLDGYASVNEYLMDTMGTKSRTKIRGYVRKLETCFNITYKLYFGSISKPEYDQLFEKLHLFINKRFQQRGDTHELMANWEFIEKSSYEMILDKTASLFVIYNDKVPIDICLNYHYQNIFHNGIRSYDIDYSKFRLGYVDILKQMEWCLANGMGIFDLSSGDMQYKRMWCNNVYNFEHQILYDRNSIIEMTIAHGLVKFYKAKEYLKKKRVHLIYHRIRKMASKETREERKYSETPSELTVLDKVPDMGNTPTLDLRIETYAFLRKFVFDFQYQHSEHSHNIRIYKISDEVNAYYIIGKTKMLKLKLL